MQVPDLDLDVPEDPLSYDFPAPSCEPGSLVNWETLSCGKLNVIKLSSPPPRSKLWQPQKYRIRYDTM